MFWRDSIVLAHQNFYERLKLIVRACREYRRRSFRIVPLVVSLEKCRHHILRSLQTEGALGRLLDCTLKSSERRNTENGFVIPYRDLGRQGRIATPA